MSRVARCGGIRLRERAGRIGIDARKVADQDRHARNLVSPLVRLDRSAEWVSSTAGDEGCPGDRSWYRSAPAAILRRADRARREGAGSASISTTRRTLSCLFAPLPSVVTVTTSST
jgi:hypothetical protein